MENQNHLCYLGFMAWLCYLSIVTNKIDKLGYALGMVKQICCNPTLLLSFTMYYISKAKKENDDNVH